MEKEFDDTLDINNQLIMNLRDAGHTVRFLFEGKGSQRRVLSILFQNGNMTQQELTKRLGIQPGSASEVITKLESNGYISKKVSQSDRRKMDIKLTEEGRQFAQTCADERSIRHREMCSCLSPEEKKTLLELTKKLNDDWHMRYHEFHETSKREKN